MRGHSLPVAALAVATGLGASCRHDLDPPKTPRPVKVHIVEPHGAEPGVRYSANIEAYQQVTLAFKVGGYVSEIRQAPGADGRMRNLQEGDRVARGTVLARVRDSDYVESVDRAKASVAQAEAAFQKATLDYERAKRLFSSDSLTKPDFDSAKAAFESAQAQSQGAQASLAQAEIQLQDTFLVAPADGVVLARSIETGALVGAGSAGFAMADISSVKAAFGVPDLLMRRARLGVTLPVTTDVYGTREFPGKITSIAPAADPSSRVFQVELTIPNPQNLLKPGMIASVAVPDEGDSGGPAQAMLVVPLNAIVKPETSEGYSVFVVVEQGGKQVARRRMVTLDEVYGNMIAVSQGVSRGERVISSGASLVSDNEEVRLIP